MTGEFFFCLFFSPLTRRLPRTRDSRPTDLDLEPRLPCRELYAAAAVAQPGAALASTNTYTAQPPPLRRSVSPRRALQELVVDEATGDVKRQRTSLG